MKFEKKNAKTDVCCNMARFKIECLEKLEIYIQQFNFDICYFRALESAQHVYLNSVYFICFLFLYMKVITNIKSSASKSLGAADCK
jgi:hypothetical protein